MNHLCSARRMYIHWSGFGPPLIEVWFVPFPSACGKLCRDCFRDVWLGARTVWTQEFRTSVNKLLYGSCHSQNITSQQPPEMSSNSKSTQRRSQFLQLHMNIDEYDKQWRTIKRPPFWPFCWGPSLFNLQEAMFQVNGYYIHQYCPERLWFSPSSTGGLLNPLIHTNACWVGLQPSCLPWQWHAASCNIDFRMGGFSERAGKAWPECRHGKPSFVISGRRHRARQPQKSKHQRGVAIQCRSKSCKKCWILILRGASLRPMSSSSYNLGQFFLRKVLFSSSTHSSDSSAALIMWLDLLRRMPSAMNSSIKSFAVFKWVLGSFRKSEAMLSWLRQLPLQGSCKKMKKKFSANTRFGFTLWAFIFSRRSNMSCVGDWRKDLNTHEYSTISGRNPLSSVTFSKNFAAFALYFSLEFAQALIAEEKWNSFTSILLFSMCSSTSHANVILPLSAHAAMHAWALTWFTTSNCTSSCQSSLTSSSRHNFPYSFIAVV